jgi:hypothetical protein
MTLHDSSIKEPGLIGRHYVNLRELTGKRLLIIRNDKSYVFHFDHKQNSGNRITYLGADGCYVTFRK